MVASENIGLTRATFAKLTPHPYLLANLEAATPSRSDGRAPNESRPPNANLDALSHAHGSALVRIGDTSAICGVRGETILTTEIPNYRSSNTESELRDYQLLVPNIEMATGCAPQFLPGGPPTTSAQTLSTRIYSLLHSSKLIQPSDLRIGHAQPDQNPDKMDEGEDGSDQKQDEGEDGSDQKQDDMRVVAYWVLYIDVFFISLDGNPFDAAWAATLAALQQTKIPRATYDADREMVVCTRRDPRPLSLSGLPIACTAAIFTGKETDRPTDGRYWLLSDPDRLEESLCDESVTIVVDCSAGKLKILSVSKHGGVILSPKMLRSQQLLEWAEQRWKQFHRVILGTKPAG